VIAVTTIIAVCLALLPAVATAAQTVPKAGGPVTGKEFTDTGKPRPYYAPDAVAGSRTDAGQFAESMAKMCPPEYLPASLLPENKDESRTENGSAKPKVTGTGGWTPVAQPYLPSGDANISYDPEAGLALDSSGRVHLIYTVNRRTDVSQAPDAPGFAHRDLANLYYAVYTEGSFSASTQLTSFSGLDDTDVLMLWMDPNEYLHLVYSKWTWGRDASQPAATPFYQAYQHEGESVYYRYRSPDGAWSAPRCLADFGGGSWGIESAWFYPSGNGIYGAWWEILNKETTPSTYSGRLMFVDGAKDAWNPATAVKALDYLQAPGQQIPMHQIGVDTSHVTGEVTLAFSLETIGAALGQNKADIYGVTRSASGLWSSIQSLTSASVNEGYMSFLLQYRSSGTAANILAGKESIYNGAPAFPPSQDYYLIRRTSAGWQAPENISRRPAGTVFAATDITRDPWGNWHFLFSDTAPHWNPATLQWDIEPGDEVSYTYDTGSGFSALETIQGYQAGRFVRANAIALDGDGRAHILFESHSTDPDIGTGYNVYYTDNAPGASGAGFKSPQKISPDSDRVTMDTSLSCSSNGGVLASWCEVKANYATGEPLAAAVYSRYMRGGSWGDVKTVTAIPGSNEIIHTVYSVAYKYWFVYTDWNINSVGEQRIIFETAMYNPVTATYSDFKKYYTESRAGSWGNPEQVLPVDVSGYPYFIVDANERVISQFDGQVQVGPVTQNVSYYSMQRSATPPASTYFFAEGTTRPGFQEWISIQNPCELDANVTITYMLGTGENKEQTVAVPAHSRLTVDVNTFVGAGQDVSARVSSDQLIVAERPMYFDYKGWKGGDDAVGSINSGQIWYFAEGTTRGGFQEYLTLQNPSNVATTADITYMLGDGSTKTQNVPIDPRTRATVDVNAFVGPEQDVSMKVESHEAGLVAERPMYFDYRGWTGGHNVVGSYTRSWGWFIGEGAASRWYFAEGTTRSGFDTYLCLQNPNAVSGNATITYILGDGSTKSQNILLPATSRQTVKVNDVIGPEKDVSIVVDANTPIIAERPMYFNYHGFAPGGHNAMGAGAPKNSWFFAEGTTRTGFEEWLSLENPGVANANVTITYMLGDGSVVPQTVSVPAHTRVTVDVNNAVGPGKDVSVSVWSDQGIVAERPMYFNYQGIWPGGSDVMGL